MLLKTLAVSSDTVYKFADKLEANIRYVLMSALMIAVIIILARVARRLFTKLTLKARYRNHK